MFACTSTMGRDAIGSVRSSWAGRGAHSLPIACSALPLAEAAIQSSACLLESASRQQRRRCSSICVTTRVNLAGMGGLDPACCPCKSLGEKGHGVWTAVATIVLDEEVA